jgi:hypothetical protein
MRGDWKDYRPAIWMAMLGVAVMLLISPFYIGAVLLGAAIGAAIRITQRRRAFAAAQARKAGGRRAKPGGRAKR